MKPSHRTQPYRGGRKHSAAMMAMKRGRARFGSHPMDARRRLQKRRKRLSQMVRARY